MRIWIGAVFALWTAWTSAFGANANAVNESLSILAVCPPDLSITSIHRVKLGLANSPKILLVVDNHTRLPDGCSRLELPFPITHIRWLGVLPTAEEPFPRIAITARQDDGEIQSIEVERPPPSVQPPAVQIPEWRPEGELTEKPAAWAWQPEVWIDTPGDLLAKAKETGIGTLYISVPIQNGQVEHASALSQFIAKCRAANIAVVAVEGDPKMTTPTGLVFALTRAQALAVYQSSATERLSGVQYDIEPYLLADFHAAPALAWARWSEALLSLSNILGEPLDVVVPYWITESPGGEAALTALRPAIRHITAMTYRTTPKEIAAAAAPILGYAENNGLMATIALEAGPLARERRDIFMPAERGELHLIALENVKVALLLKDKRPAEGTKAFRLSHSIPADPSRVTFFGQKARLLEVAKIMKKKLTAFPAAQRLAFHGLFEFSNAGIKGNHSEEVHLQ